jgi:hypothetical protein
MAGGGMIGVGRQALGGALQGGAAAAAREKERNAANEQIKAAERAQKRQTQMSAAGMGAMAGGYLAAGTALGGPAGAAIGAVVGLFAGSLFG